MKVGGAGKSSRKGAVSNGGIVKWSESVDRKENKQPTMLFTASTGSEDWRPSREEYMSISLKKKHLLCNKISACNFHVRQQGEHCLCVLMNERVRRIFCDHMM